ncbi:LOB domain-containing protein 42-like [Vicia villosa]|uniref:LOB domain-containing protein 42-like n=1 Tax=Vicia villosa TaxID=3911 RepID=UPI00273AA32D|nr:LOB domain-containing protein 42-like [Vicia villosa]
MDDESGPRNFRKRSWNNYHEDQQHVNYQAGEESNSTWLKQAHQNEVPLSSRAGLFQSLMYEAVGRTINPVNGAVGLLWTGRWRFCQLGVEQVLRGNGGALTPLPDHESSEKGSSSRHHQNHQQKLMIEENKTQSEESESLTLGSRTGTENYSYVYANSQTQTNQLLKLFL